MNNKQIRYLIFSLAVLFVAVGLFSIPSVNADSSKHTTSNVFKFDPFPIHGEQVEGAQAQLVTNEAGATMQIQTAELIPGDAVTVWWVIFNNPSACAGYPDEACTLGDLLGNTAAVGGEVTYAAGHVIGESGMGNFAGHLSVGHTSQEWFGTGFTNPTGAEIHLVVHTHGQVIPELADDMVRTFRGGCHDDDFINTSHPAYNDGTPGPNDCVDVQFAVFRQ